MTYTVEKVERRTKPGHAASLVFGFDAGQPVEGWFAEVRTDIGGTVRLSKLDGEESWVIDDAITAKGLPIIVTGFGSRASVKHVPDDELQGLLDQAVI